MILTENNGCFYKKFRFLSEQKSVSSSFASPFLRHPDPKYLTVQSPVQPSSPKSTYQATANESKDGEDSAKMNCSLSISTVSGETSCSAADDEEVKQPQE